MSIHFIGVDAGGTQTRAVLTTKNGQLVGSGRAAGANSWSSGTSVAGTVSAAIRDALGEYDPASVAAGVVAIAGGGTTEPEIGAEIELGWRSLGLPGSPRVVIDVLAAFAAAATAADGLVLAAGTGSIAARIGSWQLERRAGGHGWLVGDEGSAVWLGIEGTRAALRALDGRGPQTSLATALPDVLEVDGEDATTSSSRIVSVVNARAPARMGELAPIVVNESEHGDAVARALIESASVHLVGIATAAMGEQRPEIVVLAGSLLTQAAPIRSLVRGQLMQVWPEVPIIESQSGEAGAVALAITWNTGASLSDAALERLREGSRPGTADSSLAMRRPGRP